MKKRRYTGKLDSTMYCSLHRTDYDMKRRTMAEIADSIIHDISFDKMCYRNARDRDRKKLMEDSDKENHPSEEKNRGELIETFKVAKIRFKNT